jgi:tRNA nucleotidyltransferase (CCA-adding enzyme)
LIRQDLYRRDFTINSLAIALAGDRYGELVDFFGGRKDLQRREIRVLHSLSFIDDPTRAIRAVRYARRLGFSIAADTRHLISTAIGEGVFDRLSGPRLRRELENLLSEPHPTLSLGLLAELGLLPVISPDFVWSEDLRSYLLKVEGQHAWYTLEALGPPPEPWFLYLGALVHRASHGAAERLTERLQMAGEYRRRMLELPDAVRDMVAAATDPDLSTSSRMHRVEGCSPEAVLLAMAGLAMPDRRRLADAVEAHTRIVTPVSGSALLAFGIPPGPHVGRALVKTRDALVDNEIEAEDALDYAVELARAESVSEEAQ